ncbi:MAG: Holliday junction resolvase RuvX [Cellvibrionaceae bacterium]|nr:Holliday junction resolvase RuvX [Cellvibrionaceae bacterium]
MFSVLAFDYGMKNIGVAYGQSLSGTAKPLSVLKARDGIPNWLLIEQLINTWQPQRLLVGLPLNMDDSESELSRLARKFANRLQGRFGLTVALMDERLSTKAAKDLAYTRGHRGNFGKQPVDSLAAQLILEDWFRQIAPS